MNSIMNMKKKFLLTALCVLLFGTSFTTHIDARTQFSLDFKTRYIWRGFDFNPNNEPVLQPSITFGLGDSGLALNFWGSFSFEDKRVNETDITLSYEFSKMKNLSLSVGFIHYGWYFAGDFKFKDNTTQEIYVTAGLPEIPLNPTLTLYYDFNNGDGVYLVLGISRGLKLTGSITLDLSAALGYNGGMWVEEPGFSDLDLLVSLPFQLDKLSFSTYLGAVIILMDEVNPGVDSEIFAGVSLSF